MSLLSRPRLAAAFSFDFLGLGPPYEWLACWRPPEGGRPMNTSHPFFHRDAVRISWLAGFSMFAIMPPGDDSPLVVDTDQKRKMTTCRGRFLTNDLQNPH